MNQPESQYGQTGVPAQNVPGTYTAPTPNNQPAYNDGQPNPYVQGQPGYTQPNPYAQGQPSYGQPNPYAQGQPAYNYAQPNPYAQNQAANVDPLSVAILNAIRPSLKAPMTAVLCPKEQMFITNVNGEYTIKGVVHSQNSYGAMIATDFSVKARLVNGTWVISNVSVGVQAAKTYTKNFVANYIAISIFVGVMGLLGYLVLTMLIG